MNVNVIKNLLARKANKIKNDDTYLVDTYYYFFDKFIPSPNDMQIYILNIYYIVLNSYILFFSHIC